MGWKLVSTGAALAGAVVISSGCADLGGVQMGSERASTVATGSAGGSTSANANAQLERCPESLGTVAIMEDQNSRWYYTLSREYKLQSTVPLIAYVSCNPGSFARDAAHLVAGGYVLDSVMPVGQFRWSTHVELAAAFSR